jgi:microcystin degradation protein MlrC
MPNGEVAAIPGIVLLIPPACAKAGENAELQLRRVATTVAVHRRFISVLLTVSRSRNPQAASRSGGAMNSGPTGLVIVSRRMRSISVIAAESMRQPMASRTAAS